MRYRNKKTSKKVVLRLVVGLATSIFVLSLTNTLNAEDATSHKGRFWNVKSVSCGDTLENGYYKLAQNLTCVEDPAIKITGPAKLNLNNKTIFGEERNDEKDEDEPPDLPVCIEITGNRAWVWNGTVRNCADGVVIAGTGRHKLFRIKSMYNTKAGFTLVKKSNDNWLTNNEAIGNSEENFLIERESDSNYLIKNIAENGEDKGYYVRGNNNRLYKNEANGNLDDALRIRNGNNNVAIHNIFNDTESAGVKVDSKNNIVSKNIITNNANEGIKVSPPEDDPEPELPPSNKISSNVVLNNGKAGIKIDSKGNIVHKNFVKQNERGIRIRSNDNNVKKNIIINNDKEGIRVEKVELDDGSEEPSTNNLISSNIISNNGQEGIRVEDSSSNLISRNIIKNNGFIKSDPEAIRDGLKLEKEAYENTLTRNFVFNNNGNGIYVDEGSTGNSIMRNIVFSNGDDIDDSFDLNDGNDDCDSNEWKRNKFRTSNLECIE